MKRQHLTKSCVCASNSIPLNIILSVIPFSTNDILLLSQVCTSLSECIQYISNYSRKNYLFNIRKKARRQNLRLLLKDVDTKVEDIYFRLPDICQKDEYFVNMFLSQSKLNQRQKISIFEEFDKLCGPLHIKHLEWWIQKHMFLFKHYFNRLETESDNFLDICKTVFQHHIKFASYLKPDDSRTLTLIKYFIRQKYGNITSYVKVIDNQGHNVICNNNVDLMLYAIKQDYANFSLINCRLYNNINFILQALDINPLIVRKISPNMHNKCKKKLQMQTEHIYYTNIMNYVLKIIKINAIFYNSIINKISHKASNIRNVFLIIQLIRVNPNVYMHLDSTLQTNNLIIMKTFGAILNHSYNDHNIEYNFVIDEIIKKNPTRQILSKMLKRFDHGEKRFQNFVINGYNFGNVLAKYDGRIIQSTTNLEILCVGIEEILRYTLTIMKIYCMRNFVHQQDKIKLNTLIHTIATREQCDASCFYDPWLIDPHSSHTLIQSFLKQNHEYRNRFFHMMSAINESELSTCLLNLILKFTS